MQTNEVFFTARSYAQRALSCRKMTLHPSVRPSVCLSICVGLTVRHTPVFCRNG